LDNKNIITFVDDTDAKEETCIIISNTVNKTLEVIFSQLPNYSISNSIDNTRIVINTRVTVKEDFYNISIKCNFVNDESQSFIKSSKPFQILDTYSTIDSLATILINTLSPKSISIARVVLNNGLIPDDYNIYLNDKMVDKDVLNHILTGTYHLQIESKSDAKVVFDINPLTIVSQEDININFTYPIIKNKISNPSNDTSYESREKYLNFPYWSNYWKLLQKGKTIITFHANAPYDIVIAFSPFQNQQTITYQINLGGWFNTKSVIRQFTKYNPNDTESSIILTSAYSVKRENDYWIVFDKDTNSFSIGEGKDIGSKRIFSYKSAKGLSAQQYFSFSSWNNLVQYSNIKVTSE
jgi:hypothetical protein